MDSLSFSLVPKEKENFFGSQRIFFGSQRKGTKGIRRKEQMDKTKPKRRKACWFCLGQLPQWGRSRVSSRLLLYSVGCKNPTIWSVRQIPGVNRVQYRKYIQVASIFKQLQETKQKEDRRAKTVWILLEWCRSPPLLRTPLWRGKLTRQWRVVSTGHHYKGLCRKPKGVGDRR